MCSSARIICERFYSKLALDFDANKRVTDEVAVVPSKRMRNKIAGFVTVRRRAWARAAPDAVATHPPVRPRARSCSTSCGASSAATRCAASR